MKILLDTHVLLWWWFGQDRLTELAKTSVADQTNEIYVSAASVWEIATKHRIGKLPQAMRVMPGIDRHIRQSRFSDMPITLAHAELAGSLQSDHRDPFDRMLIAQARLEAMTLLSNDRVFGSFDVPLLW
jgi:PIN domain nuclease of toxin-antitoxin system